MMASVMRHFDDAERHFTDALAFDTKLRARPWLTHTQYQYAKMLVARDAPGDRAKAMGLLQQALDTAQELGMAKIVERALALKLRAQGVSTDSVYTSIDAVAGAVARERPQISVHPAPDGTVTLMFSDIEDSTVITERLGDQAWHEVLRWHDALIREQIRAYGGFEVKTIGDAFMVAFQSAKKGLECAIAIQRAFGEHNGAEGERVKVRIGLHAGEAIKDGDDFYGKNVILASRVAGQAKGGEILVSSLVRQLVESSVDPGTFGEPREVELKGLTGTHSVFAVNGA
jgi:class 3 adenylate cyclase